MRSDDLVPLLALAAASAPASGDGLNLRQGLVMAWDQLTAENTIMVDGVTLTNLPCLNTSEAAILRPGDVVSLLVKGRNAQSWAVLGRHIIPGTPEATSGYSALGSRAKTSLGADISWSGTSLDWSTAGQTEPGRAETVVSDVLVGPSGQALLIISCDILWSFQAPTPNDLVSARASARAIRQSNGAVISQADLSRSVSTHGGWFLNVVSTPTMNLYNTGVSASYVHWYSSLGAPGLYSFQMMFYALSTSAIDVNWSTPRLTVIPL